MQKQKIAVTGATGRVGRHIVDVLREQGHEPVPIARSLRRRRDHRRRPRRGAARRDVMIDAATGASSDEAEATAFFTTAARNLSPPARGPASSAIVLVSIIGIDSFSAGYNAREARPGARLAGGPDPGRGSCARRSSTSSSSSSCSGAARATSRTCRRCAPSRRRRAASPSRWSTSRSTSRPRRPDLGGRRPARGAAGRDGAAGRQRRRPARRGGLRPRDPDTATVHDRRAPAQPGRAPGRPDVRGVASPRGPRRVMAACGGRSDTHRASIVRGENGGMRRALALALVVLAGCGGSHAAAPARPERKPPCDARVAAVAGRARSSHATPTSSPASTAARFG